MAWLGILPLWDGHATPSACLHLFTCGGGGWRVPAGKTLPYATWQHHCTAYLPYSTLRSYDTTFAFALSARARMVRALGRYQASTKRQAYATFTVVSWHEPLSRCFELLTNRRHHRQRCAAFAGGRLLLKRLLHPHL